MTGIVIHMSDVRTGRLLAQRASDLPGIARRLVAAREAKALRVVDLAAAATIGTNTLSNWEIGLRRPSIEQLALIIPILEITADWVYFGDDRGLSWSVREAIIANTQTAAGIDRAAAAADLDIRPVSGNHSVAAQKNHRR